MNKTVIYLLNRRPLQMNLYYSKCLLTVEIRSSMLKKGGKTVKSYISSDTLAHYLSAT